MDVKNVADLAKIIDLCRKKGIDSIKISNDAVEFKLSTHLPIKGKPRGKYKTATAELKPDHIEVENQYSQDEILFWSSEGIN